MGLLVFGNKKSNSLDNNSGTNVELRSAPLVRGFTLIEIAMTIVIIIIIFTLGMPTLYQFYTQYQLEGEHQLLLSLLVQARTFAMVNRNESSHGVYINTNQFTVFQGINYASRTIAEDRIFPRNTVVLLSGPTEFIFNPLSGTTASTTINLQTQYAQRKIFINSEGTLY